MKAMDMHRLAQLEARRDARSAGSEICPECGHDPAAPFRFTIDTAGAEAGEDVPTEYCRRCGAIMRFSIKIDRQERVQR